MPWRYRAESGAKRATRSSNRRAPSSFTATVFGVVIRVVIDLPEELDNSSLLTPLDELLQGFIDGRLFGRKPADLVSLIEQRVVDSEIRRHRKILLTPMCDRKCDGSASTGPRLLSQRLLPFFRHAEVHALHDLAGGVPCGHVRGVEAVEARRSEADPHHAAVDLHGIGAGRDRDRHPLGELAVAQQLLREALVVRVDDHLLRRRGARHHPRIVEINRQRRLVTDVKPARRHRGDAHDDALVEAVVVRVEAHLATVPHPIVEAEIARDFAFDVHGHSAAGFPNHAQAMKSTSGGVAPSSRSRVFTCARIFWSVSASGVAAIARHTVASAHSMCWYSASITTAPASIPASLCRRARTAAARTTRPRRPRRRGGGRGGRAP